MKTTFLTGALAAALAFAWPSVEPCAAQTPPSSPIRIMVMSDQSGPYSASSGLGGVAAARLASSELSDTVLGRPVEIVARNHQNKPDVGLALARKFYVEENGDAIVDIGNSAISLAVQDLARSIGKIVIHVGSAHADLFGKDCSPTSAMWLYDTASLARALTKAVSGVGLHDWYFIAADYAAGTIMVADETRELNALGARVAGSTRVPLGTADFSGPLLQAQGSGADVISVATFGQDAQNLIKQAAEFHVQQKIVGSILDIATIKGLGEPATGVLTLAEFYWNQDDQTRAFAKLFAQHFEGKMPTDMQAADYSATRHYLRAIAAAGTTDGVQVMKEMKLMPVDDVYARNLHLREDGRLVNDMLLVQVKPMSERVNDWDVFKIVSRVPGQDGIRPLADGHCSPVK